MRMPTESGGIVPSEAYDPSLKELFVSDADFNAVEVYSTVDGHRVGEIDVPGVAGLSFSPDYAELVIGTITPYFDFANPSTLRVTQRAVVPSSQLTTDQLGMTLMPIAPYAMADGTVFLGMGWNAESGPSPYTIIEHLLLYDPTTGSFTPRDPDTGGTIGIPARSLDGKYLLVKGVSQLELHLYSTAAQGYVAVSSPVQNGRTYLAANPDGSQLVSVEEVTAAGTGGFNSQVEFRGPNLGIENQYTISGSISQPFYSRDGSYLYTLANKTLIALDTQKASPAFYLGVSIGGLLGPAELYDVDENGRLFGSTFGAGAMVLNPASAPASPPATVPDFSSASTEANPNVGPLAGGTQVQFVPAPSGTGSGDGLDSTTEAYFGATPAPEDTVAPYASSSDGENFLTATAPPATTPGPVTVVLTDTDNTVFLPDAYTYGPHLLRVEPNVASSQGGDQVTIFAYGLGFLDLPDIHVTIGGTPVNMNDAKLNSYASTAYPEQSVAVTVPPGTPGWADVTLSTSDGTDTLKRGLQYLKADTSLSGGPFSFAVYDAQRDRFYLTGNGNSVAVFDPGTETFLQPLQPSSVSSGAVLESEALTPDDSKLLVSDPADESVIIFDLASGTSTSVKVILPSDPPTTLTAPMSVATAADSRAFVSLTPCIPDPVREIDLTTLSVTTRPDAASTCTAYVPYPQLGGSSADGSTILFAEKSGGSPPGRESLWRYDASSDSFSGPVVVGDLLLTGQGVADGNGGVIGACGGRLDQRLLPLVPIVLGGLNCQLNETGSLLYSGYYGPSGSYLIVWDTQNGRRQLTLSVPEFGTGSTRPLAIDPTGQEILIATGSGVSYFELAVVPLAVGTVSPAQASAGATVQIHGSGFVAGTVVQMDGQSASCSYVNSETISCVAPTLAPGPVSLALKNPDGQTYSYSDAFTAQ